MEAILTLEESKAILFASIESTSGQHRKLLEHLLAAYPTPISVAQIQSELAMEGACTFYSALRNARIFMEVSELIDPKNAEKRYVLSDWPVRIAKLRRCMN
tara:strand:- start:778 stop:1080 length:303 start_codon:yes stop_codon:yes gene_type:complete